MCGEKARPLEGIRSIELEDLDEKRYIALDIREPDEVVTRPTGLPNVPMSAWRTPPHDRPLLLVCASGRRSLTLAKLLRAEGVEAYSLVGGVASGVFARTSR